VPVVALGLDQHEVGVQAGGAAAEPLELEVEVACHAGVALACGDRDAVERRGDPGRELAGRLDARVAQHAAEQLARAAGQRVAALRRVIDAVLVGLSAGRRELDLELAEARVEVAAGAGLEARPPPFDVVVEAAQLRGVEVDAAVGERAPAVDVQDVVIGGEVVEQGGEVLAADQVLGVDPALQRGALVELLERDAAERVERWSLDDRVVPTSGSLLAVSPVTARV
jgi:hypothetical protein